MKVKELREFIADLDDDMDIWIEVDFNRYGCEVCYTFIDSLDVVENILFINERI